MPPSEPSYPGPSIIEKIDDACRLFQSWESELIVSPPIRDMLADLDLKIAASHRAMLDTGIVSACMHCEEDEGGSCCGAGIENKYDTFLLIVNLLMGVSLARHPHDAFGCLFLGPKGCTLRARDVLCINFLCPPIQRRLALEDLVRLQSITGQEMDAIFRLTEAVRKHIRGREAELRRL